jgi:hypothetical protein
MQSCLSFKIIFLFSVSVVVGEIAGVAAHEKSSRVRAGLESLVNLGRCHT